MQRLIWLTLGSALALSPACGKGTSQEGPASPNPTATAAPAPAAAPGPAEPLAAGQAAPDFEMQAHDGTTVKMSALKGKPVVLYFYPKDETPG